MVADILVMLGAGISNHDTDLVEPTKLGPRTLRVKIWISQDHFYRNIHGDLIILEHQQLGLGPIHTELQNISVGKLGDKPGDNKIMK